MIEDRVINVLTKEWGDAYHEALMAALQPLYPLILDVINDAQHYQRKDELSQQVLQVVQQAIADGVIDTGGGSGTAGGVTPSQMQAAIAQAVADKVTAAVLADTLQNYATQAQITSLTQAVRRAQQVVEAPDAAPTEHSTNLVTSGGVWQAIRDAVKDVVVDDTTVDVWLAATTDTDLLITDTFKHALGDSITLTVTDGHLMLAYQRAQNKNLKMFMSGFEIPATKGTVTKDGTEYTTLTSKNTYTGTFMVDVHSYVVSETYQSIVDRLNSDTSQVDGHHELDDESIYASNEAVMALFGS